MSDGASPSDRCETAKITLNAPTFEQFRSGKGFALDPFQREACHSLAQGRNVLVAAPTGAGKTVVAEFAVFLALQRSRNKVFYTTPMKALSNQKFYELEKQFGRGSVGLLTGDTNRNSHARIVVMTTEVLRNMLYAGSDLLRDLSFVVLDEVHYLADAFRGPVWEEVIIHLARDVRTVSLSATISNAREFGDWLQTVRGETDVIVSDVRPVPLDAHALIRRTLIELFDSSSLANPPRVNPEVVRLTRSLSAPPQRAPRGGGRRYRRSTRASTHRSHGDDRLARADVVRLLDDKNLLPAIIFVFSRAGCDAAVRQVLRAGILLTDKHEREEIRLIVEEHCRSLPDEELAVLGYWEWLDGLECGVAAHHAGMLPAFKEVVEELFRRKLVTVVFATETLALGINMPARTVVLESLEKFNGESRVPITSGEYTQLTGRAGRRGIDVEGHAIVQWSGTLNPNAVASLASRQAFGLRSSFRPTYNMAANLIDRFGRDRTRDILELSFAQFQADRAVVNLAKRARKHDESLARESEELRREIRSRTGAIAAIFDRVSAVLVERKFFKRSSGSLTLTSTGRALMRIYGERDLLVAESLNRHVWDDLDAPSCAALACAYVYESRRDEGRADAERLPRGPFRAALGRTHDLWVELDNIERAHDLPGSKPLDPGLCVAMHGWARGASLDTVLAEADLAAGDFVRWTKQTVDLLDQISLVAEGTAGHRARSAIDSIRRGVVAYSSVA